MSQAESESERKGRQIKAISLWQPILAVVYRWRLAFNLSQSVCHARAMSPALRISRMLNLLVLNLFVRSYYAPGFHALAIKARAVQQRLPLQELRALASPHPLL